MTTTTSGVSGQQGHELNPRDERALRGRLARWSRFVRGISAQDFDDIYQDAWCKLLKRERDGCPIRHPEGALRRAISYSSLEELRRRRRRPTVALDSAPERLLTAPDAIEPAERAEVLETTRYVFETVRALSERDLQIVLLADLFGLRPAEIETRLGISERTYQRHHAAARQAIRNTVGKLLDDDRQWTAVAHSQSPKPPRRAVNAA
jgi:RNA polymerase sigma factor (sigma-70 family)